MGQVPTCGMVLAAGLGTRMRPLTDACPKPLIEVAGRTLLDRALDNFEAAGVKTIVVNVHYLAGQIEAHLSARSAAGDKAQYLISDERGELLETGGGVAKALPLLRDDTLLIANADNLWLDGPENTIARLAHEWDPARMDALLLVVDRAEAAGYDGAGDFHREPSGRLHRRGHDLTANYVFSGVQLLSRRLFADLPEGPFSLNLLYNRALAAQRLYGLVHDGLWHHVGTPEAVGEATRRLTRG
ncbi:nucleotidyltransferase family protein [Pedomonas mirosovicensis]|uniref:nucleotidyltransferase family protein n=1 Tax=Pedomonas mirosovicensis TaxID=2908641 RepID=UPI002169DF1A|nr:nucleotidyltransferase family protein [Pedomonas mirosovicensis]MCH8684288.1 nucleotidyltransferase family protein [Pedomonas mirosovicensis]